jgi:hypothetical protein
MKNHALIIGVLAGMALAGIIVLQALGRPLPDVLAAVVIAGVSALAGLAIPAVTHTAAAVAVTAPPADAPTVTVTAVPAQQPVQGAPSSPESVETVPALAVTPGMSPVQAGQAGGS